MRLQDSLELFFTIEAELNEFLEAQSIEEVTEIIEEQVVKNEQDVKTFKVKLAASVSPEQVEQLSKQIQIIHTHTNNLIDALPTLRYDTSILQNISSLLEEAVRIPQLTPAQCDAITDITKSEPFKALKKEVLKKVEIEAVHGLQYLLEDMTNHIGEINCSSDQEDTQKEIDKLNGKIDKWGQKIVAYQAVETHTPTTEEPLKASPQSSSKANASSSIILDILYGVGMIGGGVALCVLAMLTIKPIIAAIGAASIVLGGIGLAHTHGFFSKSEANLTETLDDTSIYQL